MSEMFNGFYTEPPTYIPDNMHKKPLPPKTVSLVRDNLDAILDKNGKKKGYSWNYGETVSIPISVNIPVKLEADAYYTFDGGEVPSKSTAGRIGQKFYNLKDIKSWVLTSYVPDDGSYVWIEEPRFTFPENGQRGLIATPDMDGKYILAEFINFRGEEMFERIFENVNSADFEIGIEDSLNIPRGIYDLYIYVGTPRSTEAEPVEEYKKLTKRYEIVVR